MYFHAPVLTLANEKENKVLEIYYISYFIFTRALKNKEKRKYMLILLVVSCSGSDPGQ